MLVKMLKYVMDVAGKIFASVLAKRVHQVTERLIGEKQSSLKSDERILGPNFYFEANEKE